MYFHFVYHIYLNIMQSQTRWGWWEKNVCLWSGNIWKHSRERHKRLGFRLLLFGTFFVLCARLSFLKFYCAAILRNILQNMSSLLQWGISHICIVIAVDCYGNEMYNVYIYQHYTYSGKTYLFVFPFFVVFFFLGWFWIVFARVYYVSHLSAHYNVVGCVVRWWMSKNGNLSEFLLVSLFCIYMDLLKNNKLKIYREMGKKQRHCFTIFFNAIQMDDFENFHKNYQWILKFFWTISAKFDEIIKYGKFAKYWGVTYFLKSFWFIFIF